MIHDYWLFLLRQWRLGDADHGKTLYEDLPEPQPNEADMTDMKCFYAVGGVRIASMNTLGPFWQASSLSAYPYYMAIPEIRLKRRPS